MSLLHLLEPEETIGNLWHSLVGGGATNPHYPDAAVSFAEVAGPLRVYFRGLGGDAGVELKAGKPEVSHHRLSRRMRLGRRAEKIAQARYDGDRLSLPDAIDAYPERELNRLLYYWLAAWTAIAHPAPSARAGLHATDLARIAHARHTTAAVLSRFRGLARNYDRLRRVTLELRPRRELPAAEAYVENLILESLALSPPEAGAVCDIEEPVAACEPRNYRPYLPVPLWAEINFPPDRERLDRGDDEAGGAAKARDGRLRRARRRAADQIDRRGGFFAHRFEKILTWTEFMNLHRNVEDDDEQSARKAADDHDEIGVGKIEKRAATRLAFDLDLAPADADAEALSTGHLYREWDFRRQAYHESHVRVLERVAEPAPEIEMPVRDAATERRIRAVRRRFEALRPRREILGRQLDGQELDIDEVARSVADMQARGQGSDRLYRQARETARDLSVAVLVDVSRSTESFVGDRSVLGIEREALIALVEGLQACGDEALILTFSSLRRDRVFVSRVKDFGERPNPLVRRRIAALKPGYYTRLGGAIRHASAAVGERPSKKRLLLVLSDGKPNDLDHYEGRYGVEDTRKAVQEARRAGQAVFGITVDDKAQSYIAHIFGAGGFAILSHPSRLTAALPVLYQHLVA